LIRIAIGMTLCLMVLVLGTVAAARIEAVPQIRELPPAYLPGMPAPKDISCYTPPDEHLPRCVAQLWGQDVYFTFDVDTQIITYALIPAQEYTVGMLIAAWGTPTGITQYEVTIHLYWGFRSALLYANSLQPESPVVLIMYELSPQQASSWRGFVQRKR
jgi:hypothetical protein